jgi:hypothetical protein
MLRAKAKAAGQRLHCPNPACGELLIVPERELQGAGRSAPQSSEDLAELCTYLREGKPATIATGCNATMLENNIRYYEAVAADAKSPHHTFFILTGQVPAEDEPAFLVVVTGERSEFDRQWDFAPTMKRVLPSGTWKDLFTERDGSYSGFDPSGYTRTSFARARFNELSQQILQGKYDVNRVIRPMHPPPERNQRWDVTFTGEEFIHPTVACEICGDNRVVLGFDGSHIRCGRCGITYCRRNCQASIRGQCPRCGEADRLNSVERTPDDGSNNFAQSHSRKRGEEETVAELRKLIGSDGGFANKALIRAIGEELNREGGMTLMRRAYNGVRTTGRYFSQDIWDGIGNWRS